jgi:predicted house-cleaning noncanonical NTP pyrophosphatase (MazG superfamily)
MLIWVPLVWKNVTRRTMLPKLLFSRHHAKHSTGAVWQKSGVGLKALGLRELPMPWTPAFAVVPSDIIKLCLDKPGTTATVLRPKLFADILIGKDGAIVRSSAAIENMEARGVFESERSSASLEEIAQTCVTLLKRQIRKLGLRRAKECGLALIVQEWKRPVSHGHLTNERRVSREPRNWLCEFEGGTQVQAHANVQVKNKFIGPAKPLSCKTRLEMIRQLRIVAAKLTALDRRCHCEWVWDGDALWIVQKDDITYESGLRPATSEPHHIEPLIAESFQLLVESTRAAQKWKKAESTDLFQQAGLPHAQLFVLEDRNTIAGLVRGEIADTLHNDLTKLLTAPIVIRTDTQTNQTFNLPRSGTLTNTVEAEKWLMREAKQLYKKRKLTPGKFCFLIHRYLRARAGAWGWAHPNETRVIIDALWGFPDGLQYYPHDSYIVDTRAPGKAARQIRAKPYFLAENEGGGWVQKKCPVPWDWRSTLRPDEEEEIARMTKRLADHLGKPRSVMFFVGVDPDSGPALLPWVLLEGEPPDVPEDEEFFHGGTRCQVRNPGELSKLGQKMKKDVGNDKPYISLLPDPEFIRSNPFIAQVAKVAKKYKMPVQLEGSILSHAYYVLNREGVHVRCRSPFEQKGRRIFYKLVRDRIPAKIEAGGEEATVLRASPKDMERLLKTKALEEAFEFFWESDPKRSFEEMADLLEVLQSACVAAGYTFEQLQAVAAQKRAERGGFDAGKILAETRHRPLLDKEDREFGFESDQMLLAGIPRMPRFRIRRVSENEFIVPLVPEERNVGEFVLPLADDQHELAVRYSRVHVRIVVRPKRMQEPKNQLWLDLNLPKPSSSDEAGPNDLFPPQTGS